MDRNERLIDLLLAEVERKDKAMLESQAALSDAFERVKGLETERDEFIKRRDEAIEKQVATRALISDLIDAVRGKAFKLSTEDGGTETLSVYYAHDLGKLGDFFLSRAIGLDET